jgi:hypothetical protein
MKRLMCVVTLLVCAGTIGLASEETWPNQHQKRADKQSKVTEQAQPEPDVPFGAYSANQAALRDALAALHAEQEARAKDKHPQQEPWNAPSVLVQMALLVVGVFYTWFAKRQWEAIKDQTRLTEESLIADKRAFVAPDTVMSLWESGQTSGLWNWRLRPRWRNTGGTPTKNLRMHIECEIRNAMLPPGYAFKCDATNVGTGMIPPNTDMLGGIAPAYPQAAITPQDIIDSQQGRKFIYLWGWARYYDVFPDTVEHLTHFCWLIVVTGDPMTFVPNTPGTPPTPGTLSFWNIQHTEGNYTEDKFT